MAEMRKITVEVPEDLLDRALAWSGEGIYRHRPARTHSGCRRARLRRSALPAREGEVRDRPRCIAQRPVIAIDTSSWIACFSDREPSSSPDCCSSFGRVAETAPNGAPLLINTRLAPVRTGNRQPPPKPISFRYLRCRSRECGWSAAPPATLFLTPASRRVRTSC